MTQPKHAIRPSATYDPRTPRESVKCICSDELIPVSEIERHVREGNARS